MYSKRMSQFELLFPQPFHWENEIPQWKYNKRRCSGSCSSQPVLSRSGSRTQGFAILLSNRATDNWPHGMQDIFAGQIESRRDLCLSRRFLVALFAHHVIAKSRNWIPLLECTMLSMQVWRGRKQPSNALFAAFTIASTFSVVISPCHKTIRGSPGIEGNSSLSMIPRMSRSVCKYLSCILKKS